MGWRENLSTASAVVVITTGVLGGVAFATDWVTEWVKGIVKAENEISRQEIDRRLNFSNVRLRIVAVDTPSLESPDADKADKDEPARAPAAIPEIPVAAFVELQHAGSPEPEVLPSPTAPTAWEIPPGLEFTVEVIDSP